MECESGYKKTMSSDRRPAVGIQNSVLGWDDPWNPETSRRCMRTGEGRIIASQDPTPTPSEYLGFVRSIGAEFVLQHVLPEDEGKSFAGSAGEHGMPYLLGNEVGNANGPYRQGLDRYDLDETLVARAREAGRLLGLVYDEPEHLQMHPGVYTRLHRLDAGHRHHLCPRDVLSLEEADTAIARCAARIASRYAGVPVYTEHVFPVLYHALARGGLHPCPKLLKEEFQSIQLATAMGAALQYRRRLGICVDLWGPDVGRWFTRLWAFPGHSPTEYAAALRLGYLLGPNLLFTENVDALARFHDEPNRRFEKSEFGEVFERFARDFVPTTVPPWTHLDFTPSIALVRSDDGDVGGESSLLGTSLSSTAATRTPHLALHLLSRGALPKNGLTWFLPQFPYHAVRFKNDEMLARYPLENGYRSEPETSSHTLFHPLNNVAVFDERVTARDLACCRLIVLAGSRAGAETLRAIGTAVRAGATCVVAGRFATAGDRELVERETGLEMRRDGDGRWYVTDDLLSDATREIVEPFLGESGCWRFAFGDDELRIHDPHDDGVSLEFEVRRASFGTRAVTYRSDA
jgi:hypothetical protein